MFLKESQEMIRPNGARTNPIFAGLCESGPHNRKMLYNCSKIVTMFDKRGKNYCVSGWYIFCEISQSWNWSPKCS